MAEFVKCFFLLFIVINSAAFIVNSVGGALIQGPLPMSVVAPIGDTVKFACVVNSSELTGAFVNIFWMVNDQQLAADANQDVKGEDIKTGTLCLDVAQDNTPGVSIRCSAITRIPPLSLSETFSNSTATLTAYGPPQSPSNLTTKLIQVDTLSLSWSAPPSPPTVQLNYTVTVTNTNTSVVRNFITSNTTITLTRGDVEGDGECDEYVWNVTAVNPAGASDPANHSTPVTLSSAPNISELDVFICNRNLTLIIMPLTDSNNINYTLVFENSYSNNMNTINNFSTVELVGSVTYPVPYPENLTNIFIVAENMCKSARLAVNISNTVECRTVETTSISLLSSVSSNTAVTPSPSPSLPPVTNTVPSVASVVAVAAAVSMLLLLVIGSLLVMCYFGWRKKRKARELSITPLSVKPMISNEVKALPQSDLQPVSSQPQNLPDYMTPADARKEVQHARQQNGGSSGGTLTNSQDQGYQPLSTGNQPAEYAVPDVPSPKPPMTTAVVDTGNYSDVWQKQKGSSLRTSQLGNSSQRDSFSKKHSSHHSSQREPSNKKQPFPPPPPPPGQDYASLQHDVGPQPVSPGVVEDLPHYSTVSNPQGLPNSKYSQLQFPPPSSGPSLVIASDSTTVEYSQVQSPEDAPPPLPPPPSDAAVEELCF